MINLDRTVLQHVLQYSGQINHLSVGTVYLMPDTDLFSPVMCAVGAVSVLLCADLEIN